MKFGVNTQIWVAPFQQTDIGLIDKVAKMGFEVIELGFFSAEPPFSVDDVRQRLKDTGLTAGICSFLSADRDITSTDPEARRRGIEFMKAMIRTLAKLGGEIFSGPIYAELFRKRYLQPDQRAPEWERGVNSMREIAKIAKTQGVTIALEPLNRFETDFLNLSEQAVRLSENVGSTRSAFFSIRSIWESKRRISGAAIRRPANISSIFSLRERSRHARHGQVPWKGVREALRGIGYDRIVAIEGFNPDIVDLANGACIWRPMAPSPDRLAGDGVKFLKTLFA